MCIVRLVYKVAGAYYAHCMARALRSNCTNMSQVLLPFAQSQQTRASVAFCEGCLPVYLSSSLHAINLLACQINHSKE
jgi:hypothetical protein